MTIITNNKWYDYFITPEVVNENIKYWVNKPQLKVWLEVWWEVWWNNYKLITWEYTAWYNWLVTINVWFTPKYIEILAFFSWTNWMTWSEWFIDDTQNFCRSVKYTSSTNLQQNWFETSSFHIQEFLSTNAIVWNVSIITNWLTIQATYNRSSFNMKYIIKCYW